VVGGSTVPQGNNSTQTKEKRPNRTQGLAGHPVEALDLLADLLLDLADAAAEHLVHGAVAVGGIDALDRVHEARIEMGENPHGTVADAHRCGILGAAPAMRPRLRDEG
jgi:hypothetical protein